MSDVMKPVKFKKLLYWILEEFKNEATIFGIPEDKFYQKPDNSYFKICGEKCETPLGPAAGPHTQQTPNIVASYLTGSRFFELKTVQVMDNLDIEKPCIDATDEGYNTEWSTELTVQQAYEEYVKSWFLLHLLSKMLKLSKVEDRAFVFNMSVGYDLKGIKDAKIDNFIEGMKDASHNPVFLECKKILTEAVTAGDIPNLKDPEFVENISPHISTSITLSTMHGCPPQDQELICKYLIGEKKLHTFLKMNPTLHGYEYVKKTFEKLGYNHITLKEASFTQDMQYEDAVKMVKVLLPFAEKNGVEFGAKLSNTLAVVNDKGLLPTDEMYMSGRALYPLTINLAKKLTYEFNGELKISYAGGANWFNVKELFEIGIKPITIATDLLKPGGYYRLKQIATKLETLMKKSVPQKIDLVKLDKLADNALFGKSYHREARYNLPMKINKKLKMTDCFIAPCVEACPINQDVPEYIRLIGEERYSVAFELIFRRNPLPHITGYICDHKCMYKCVRNDYEEPVLIRELKRIAAETGFTEYIKKLRPAVPPNKVKIAVIGAGPAGLASSCFLAREGFDVTVFDKTNKIGGTVVHTIPRFRLPQKAIEQDIELIKKMSVKFQLNTNEDIDISDLKSKGFKYINLAIGASRSRMLKLAGDTDSILGAIKFLRDWNKDPEAFNWGRNIAVIGGGNSAMDSARAARKTPGVENVYIIYRRTINEMPADREELENALQDGVIFRELLNPVALNEGFLKCQKMKLGEPDASGRKRPVPIPDKFVKIKIDTVLSAIGEIVDYDLLNRNGIEIDKTGNICVSEFNETSVENVFISGDALRGPSTVVESIADAQSVANGIIAKENIIPERKNASDYKFDYQKRQSDIRKKKGIIKPTVKILKTEKEIAEETTRCLECNFICNKCVEVCPNRANITIKVPGFQDENQILHLDGLCNECGNCETFCPYEGAPYKDKLTLYWTDEDMAVNSNSGFLLLGEGDEIKFKIRLDEKLYYPVFNKSGKLLSCKSKFEIVNEETFDNLLAMIWTTYKKHRYVFR